MSESVILGIVYAITEVIKFGIKSYSNKKDKKTRASEIEGFEEKVRSIVKECLDEAVETIQGIKKLKLIKGGKNVNRNSKQSNIRRHS
ncbi:hypothetical protein AB3N61_09315 [Leptospira sp. WS58.C1]|uniref:hypothetical protein n=1 Tax=Leptospira cinconiae TaxID=3235173 RepID=UPI00349EB695